MIVLCNVTMILGYSIVYVWYMEDLRTCKDKRVCLKIGVDVALRGRVFAISTSTRCVREGIHGVAASECVSTTLMGSLQCLRCLTEALFGYQSVHICQLCVPVLTL